MMPPRLRGEALAGHLFLAAEGEHRDADLAHLREVWQACGDQFGMSAAVPGLGLPLEPDWAAGLGETTRIVAARTLPGTSGVGQAILRRERDVFCLSVMVEPDSSGPTTWVELEDGWKRACGRPSPGTLGVTSLFMARLADPTQTPTAGHGLAPENVPADPAAPGDWQGRGVVVPQDFAVWEVSAPDDDRVERRLVVVAAGDRDAELSAWAWIGPNRRLPPFAKYLLHAAKLRYQLRVWRAGREGLRRLRREADDRVQQLLNHGVPSGSAALVEASRMLDALQARELRLTDRLTRLRELRRTTDIAADNMARFGEGSALGGLFDDDRALAEWFGLQLDDDATYLEAALQRSERIGALMGQLVERSRQRRQESVNLGLTGAVGAILMGLSAIQAFQFVVPLPPLVKPAVVTALGSLALLASLVVLRVVVPERQWSLTLVRAGAGAVGASLAWVVVAAVAGQAAGVATTWTGACAGFLAGVSATVIWPKIKG
ncbi:CATRA conflict system CASPASE/TPR repeat-associated protein [Streptomyces sp. 4N509B]|uniref:CATRA conflict system CASPASE/TPR repeat-associated protein n=1 Tax=Streptomyces sp. 4N509B TaxID=3457413 RepID=UPI003FD190A1